LGACRQRLVLLVPPSSNSHSQTCQMNRQETSYPWSRRWRSIQPILMHGHS
jgi:hypothetical protein